MEACAGRLVRFSRSKSVLDPLILDQDLAYSAYIAALSLLKICINQIVCAIEIKDKSHQVIPYGYLRLLEEPASDNAYKEIESGYLIV